MTDLITLASTLPAGQLAALRLISTWHVRKIRGKWVAPVKRVSQIDLNAVHYQGLARIAYGHYPELVLTGLGRDLLALKGEAKTAAPSFQEKAA